MTGMHIVIKTLLMQNLGYAGYLSELHNTISEPIRYLSACKGAATALLLPMCMPVYSMNCIFRFKTLKESPLILFEKFYLFTRKIA
jgi:hypothetical protein